MPGQSRKRFAHRSVAFLNLSEIIHLLWMLPHKGMTAAGVGPHIWEGDLAGGALLEEQAIRGIKQKHAESPMQDSLWLARIESVHIILASRAYNVVGVVYSDALVLPHQVFLGASACTVASDEIALANLLSYHDCSKFQSHSLETFP